MTELLNGFRTVDDDVYRKKRDSAGRTYYVREGDGRISESAYQGAQSRFQVAITSDDGSVLPDLRDSPSLDDLKAKTKIPFDRVIMPSRRQIPDEDVNPSMYNQFMELKRFNSFYERKIEDGEYDRDSEADRLAAAKEYLEFRARISEADSQRVRESIRREYMDSGY